MLNNATYDLMESATILSKGLHRYRTFENDSKSCPDCQTIWTYMQRLDEEQLDRVLNHLRQHLGKEGELKLRSA